MLLMCLGLVPGLPNPRPPFLLQHTNVSLLANALRRRLLFYSPPHCSSYKPHSKLSSDPKFLEIVIECFNVHWSTCAPTKFDLPVRSSSLCALLLLLLLPFRGRKRRTCALLLLYGTARDSPLSRSLIWCSLEFQYVKNFIGPISCNSEVLSTRTAL